MLALYQGHASDAKKHFAVDNHQGTHHNWKVGSQYNRVGGYKVVQE